MYLQKQIDELKQQKMMQTTGSINFAETRESFGDKDLHDKLQLLLSDLEAFKN